MNRTRIIFHIVLTLLVTVAVTAWLHCVFWVTTYAQHLVIGTPRMLWGSPAGLVIGVILGLIVSIFLVCCLRSVCRPPKGGNDAH